jgi:hypothetical protein
MEEDIKIVTRELLFDQLSPVTRSAKKTMLVFASLSCLISFTGVVPEEATILGFKFPGLTPSLIRWVLLILLVHSYLSFIIHLIPDYLRSQTILDDYNRVFAVGYLNSQTQSYEEDERDRELRDYGNYKEPKNFLKWTKLASFGRLALDFGFPTAFGLFSLVYFFLKLP